jgi:serine/threonine protein kinase
VVQAGRIGVETDVDALTHAAPELLAKPELTCSSDVYAFGVLMYEVLSGCCPFEGFSVPDLVVAKAARHTAELLPLLLAASAGPDGGALAAAFRAFVASHPAARPTADQLFDRLARAAALCAPPSRLQR